MKPWKRTLDEYSVPFWTRGPHRIERWEGLGGHGYIYVLSGPCGDHVTHVRLRDAKWMAEKYDRKTAT